MQSDTICALATATGGAIGMIRISGSKAIECTDNIFHANNGIPLKDAHANTLHYGTITDKEGSVIDEVIVSVFKAPHSYTGEDSVEISCHGSSYILKKVIEILIDNGCRQASAGEYTKRAFLNGKMDLSQAEAVADLIASTNKATHDIALSQLKGKFSSELKDLREELLKISSLIELELDFSEEDVTFADRQSLLTLSEKIKERISSLLHSFELGKALKEGIPVAIIGKTNVGKSTLLNRLLHDDKAIVSNIHGTTRDSIEDTTIINGVCFRFIDTAGLRKTTDEVENIGIERTYQKIAQARIILWVVDAMPTQAEKEEIQVLTKGKTLIEIFNKADRNPSTGSETTAKPYNPKTVKPYNRISAKYDKDLSKLETAIFEAADIHDINEEDVIVTNARHYDALSRSHDDIIKVIRGLKENLSGDLLAEDLRHCTHTLAEITGGEIQSTDILNSIFSHFCIGK